MIGSSRLGLIGELKVMAELLLLGYNPAKSYLDDGIDLILDNGLKIQVKSIEKAGKDGYVRVCMAKGNNAQRKEKKKPKKDKK